MIIGETGDAVFAPTIGAAACLIMAQIIPRGSARTVVLADRSPLALAQIWAPATPVLSTLAAFFHPELFSVHRLRHVNRLRCGGFRLLVWVCLVASACLSFTKPP